MVKNIRRRDEKPVELIYGSIILLLILLFVVALIFLIVIFLIWELALYYVGHICAPQNQKLVMEGHQK